MEILKWLESWYASQCDGEWEHGYGVRIDTLDNPGWQIKIDLIGTSCQIEEIPFKRVERTERDWYDLSLKDGVFNAAGDPSKLTFLLEKFKEVIDSFKAKTEREAS